MRYSEFSSYSYHGMPDQLLHALQAGTALKFGGSEFSLVGSTAALNAVVACVKGKQPTPVSSAHLTTTGNPNAALASIPGGWSGIYRSADKIGGMWHAERYSGDVDVQGTCKLLGGTFIICK